MEKSKIGLPVSVMGALAYLLFLFGGFTPGLLVVGFILLCEENAGLKKTAFTTVLVAVALSAVNLVIGLLPDIGDLFRCLAAMFGGYLNTSVLSEISGFLYAVLALARTVIFVGLAVLELMGKPFKISIVDKLLH